MHPSLRVFSAQVYEPVIRFVGKRRWPSPLERPHAHPAAPPELKQNFSDFLRKSEPPSSATPGSIQSSSKTSQNTSVFPEYWEAPDRFWRPKVRELEAAEIDAILTGGASLR